MSFCVSLLGCLLPFLTFIFCIDSLLSFFCFFFFKQKTAYEMRISDWSSDVCSSDLLMRIPSYSRRANQTGLPMIVVSVRSEERRVGKECVVRVDLGGRRIIKKKNT